MDKRAVSKNLVPGCPDAPGPASALHPRADAGAIYYLHMERSLQQELQQRLLATNHQLRHVFIEPYLHELERQFSLIYDRVKVEDISGPRLLNTETYLREWRLYKGSHGGSRLHLCGHRRAPDADLSRLAGGCQFRPQDAPLVSAGQPASGEMVWTEPYYDYTNGNLVIALARAITDREGRVRGVFAVDAILAPFSAQLNRQWNSGYQMIVNQSGKVLAHPDPSRLLKPMTHPSWLSRFNGADGIFLDPESRQFVAYSRLPERNWC